MNIIPVFGLCHPFRVNGISEELFSLMLQAFSLGKSGLFENKGFTFRKGETFFHRSNQLPPCRRQIFREIPAMF
jgi:hypothetical protein